MLHVRSGNSIRSDLRSWRTDEPDLQLPSVYFKELVIEGAAESVLLDDASRVAGVRVNSTYDVTTLFFSLKDLDVEAQYAVLESQILLLQNNEVLGLVFQSLA